MNTPKDFRTQARRALTGKWKKWILLFALTAAFADAFGLNILLNRFFSKEHWLPIPGYGMLGYTTPDGFGWILAALVVAFMLASCITVVGRFRAARAAVDDEEISVKTLFPWKLLGKCVAMNVVRFAMVWLWSLLLIIPGMVAIYKYAMADYLLAENPDLGPIEVLRESRTRTYGFKMSLFALDLSFIGWIFLMELVSMGMNQLFNNLKIENAVGLAAIDGIFSIVMWFITAALTLYRVTAQTLFFMRVEKVRANPYFDDGQPQANPYAGSGNPYAQYAQKPEEATPEPAEEEASVDDAKAEEMYFRYHCSRIAMRNAGVLEAYEQTNVASYREEIWRRDYGNELMRRFSSDPDALNGLLALASEYSMDGLTDRVLERIERHIREESVSAEEVLNMAGRVLAMLTSGAFETNAGFVARKKTQIIGMADRMEARLRRSDPDGDWANLVGLIRNMCA